MAATRSVASKTFQRVAVSARQLRQLHITDPASLPARTAALDSSRLRSPPNVDVLKAERKSKRLQSKGSKSELAERLGYPVARTFSTSDSSYDSTYVVDIPNHFPSEIAFHRSSTPAAFSPTNQSRHLNTSRSLKAVGDSSTIEFAHLPVFPTPSLQPEIEDIRVPLLPQNSRTDGSKAPMASEIDDIDEMPYRIFVVSAESTHVEGGPAVMTETEASDSPKELDFQGVARQVALGLEREGGEDIRKGKGLLKQVWTGFVDDLFGQKGSKS